MFQLHPDNELPLGLRQVNQHVHLVHNSVVTAEKLTCLIQQIEEFQNNQTVRVEALENPNIKLIKFLLERSKGVQIDTDTTSELAPPSETAGLLAAWKEYYAQNAEKMQAHYNQTQIRWQQHLLDISWADEFKILAKTAWQATKHSFITGLGLDVLNKTLHACGIKSSHCEWIAHVVNLGLMAYASTTWYPLMVSTSALALSKMVGASDSSSRLLSTATGIATVVTENFTLDAFGALNFTVAAAASTASGYVGSHLIDGSIFLYKRATENRLSEANQAPNHHQHQH